MKTLRVLLQLILILAVSPTWATEGGGASNGGGGGDGTGLEFMANLKSALTNIDANKTLSAKIDTRALRALLPNLRVLVMNRPLYAKVDGVTQESVALNFPDRKLIEINRFRWEQIANHTLKEGIALHEVESLLSTEATGAYALSALYVQTMGSQAQDLAKTANRPLITRLLGTATLRFPLSARFSRAQSNGVGFLLCRIRESDQACPNVSQDLDGQAFAPNKTLKIRPGRYLMRVYNAPDSVHAGMYELTPIYFEVGDGETYTVKVTEVFASSRERGHFSFDTFTNLDDESQYVETMRIEDERGATTLGVSTFTIDAGTEPDYRSLTEEGGWAVLRWHLCRKAVANPDADTQTVANCRVFLKSRKLTADLYSKIAHSYKLSATSLNIAALQVHVPRFTNGDVAGVLSADLQTYLAANPTSVPFRDEKVYNDAFTIKELRAVQQTRVAHGDLTRETAYVLAPGSYILRWTNESGDSEDRALQVGTQPTLSVSP